MHTTLDPTDRKTSVDTVFDELHRRIVTLALMPGAKLSEVEVATEFEVSRQPVRDAFARLGSMGFLLVRPQKATTVTPFSAAGIANARFVRQALEVEVMRCLAVEGAAAAGALAELDANLARQTGAAARRDVDAFHACDTEFHRLLCLAAGQPEAHRTVQAMKTQVDRLCLLGLGHGREIETLVEDHRRLVATIGSGDEAAAIAAMRLHLRRLDGTIAEVRRSHAGYFED